MINRLKDTEPRVSGDGESILGTMLGLLIFVGILGAAMFFGSLIIHWLEGDFTQPW